MLHPMIPSNISLQPSIYSALPFEEYLPLDWSKFSTLIDVNDLQSLDKQLDCLRPKVRREREKLGPHLLHLLHLCMFVSSASTPNWLEHQTKEYRIGIMNLHMCL